LTHFIHNKDYIKIPGTALLSKSLDIIECIAETEQRLKIKEIAQITGYLKPTLYRILSSLISRGMIQQDVRDNAYSHGPKFTELAGSITQNTELIAMATPPLKRLAAKFGETVNLSVLSGEDLQAVALWDGLVAAPTSEVGSRKPLYCTASGKALLAFLPKTRQVQILEKPFFEILTPNTIDNTATLKSELAMVQASLFAKAS
jgi:IclR family KDG regulon transcriptional repressor